MAKDDAGGAGGQGRRGGVLLLVCMTCGREYQFEEDEPPPEGLSCEKCGGEVFRRFDDEAVPDEVQSEFREDTERDLDTDDPEGDVTRTDLHDLNP